MVFRTVVSVFFFCFASDLLADRIFAINVGERELREFDVSGNLVRSLNDGAPAPVGKPLYAPFDVLVTNSGDILVSQRSRSIGYFEIRRFNSDGSEILPFTSSPINRMGGTRGMALSPSGNIYVASGGGGSFDFIMEFSPDGPDLGNIIGDTESGLNFHSPAIIAVDSQGNIYLAQNFNGGRVLKFDSNGTFVSTVAEDINTYGMDVDSNDNLFVAAAVGGSSSILKYGSDGTSQGTFVDGLGLTVSIEFGPGGNLYAADATNDKVLSYRPDGTLDFSFGVDGELGAIGIGASPVPEVNAQFVVMGLFLGGFVVYLRRSKNCVASNKL